MSRRILLAEDDPDIQLIARLALKRAGFDVAVAGTGTEALEAVRQCAPEAVLLDWMMPELDGPATCACLKQDPATRDIPVIFLTARSQESEVRQGIALGAAGYIVKPFDALTLGARVAALLERHGDAAEGATA
ncbi:MAG TPA: response regulator [Vicinamibacterales bacterium]|nr:response regulator [Vicinamibacterales bacterium]